MLNDLPLQLVNLFISYHHKDEEFRKELETHLSTLKERGYISIWNDREIAGGEEWAKKIDTHLNAAHIILLLVSSDFLASTYCYGTEMKQAIERHNAGEACVVPIILRFCDWHGAPFGKLQALPIDGKPVYSPHWHSRDQAFYNITQGIGKAVEKIRNKEAPLQVDLKPSLPSMPKPLPIFRLATILLVIVLGSVLLFFAFRWMYFPFLEKTQLGGNTQSLKNIPTIQITPIPTAVVGLYTVKNTDETSPDGVYFRYSLQSNPSVPTPTPISGLGVFHSELIRVSCWAKNDKVSGDSIWYYAYNENRPTVEGIPNKGWINAHYVSDGAIVNRPASGIPQCTSPLPVGGSLGG